VLKELIMPFILSVDYDGTLFEGSWPEKGAPKQDVIDKVKEFKANKAELVLWTCREGKSLEEALTRCKEVGLEFDAVNANAPSQLEYMKEREAEGEIFATHKIFANFYLDDRAYNIDLFLKIDAKATCDRFNNY
jgi:hypothetical protein